MFSFFLPLSSYIFQILFGTIGYSNSCISRINYPLCVGSCLSSIAVVCFWVGNFIFFVPFYLGTSVGSCFPRSAATCLVSGGLFLLVAVYICTSVGSMLLFCLSQSMICLFCTLLVIWFIYLCLWMENFQILLGTF